MHLSTTIKSIFFAVLAGTFFVVPVSVATTSDAQSTTAVLDQELIQKARTDVNGAALSDNAEVDPENAATVPVPPALLLFGSGVFGLGLLARRRGQNVNQAVVAKTN